MTSVFFSTFLRLLVTRILYGKQERVWEGKWETGQNLGREIGGNRNQYNKEITGNGKTQENTGIIQYKKHCFQQEKHEKCRDGEDFIQYDMVEWDSGKFGYSRYNRKRCLETGMMSSRKSRNDYSRANPIYHCTPIPR